MNRISRTFNKLRALRQKALVAYVTAGFPEKSTLSRLVPLMEKAGVDILEIGIPFSDPIADGPTIQHSSQVALRNGVTLRWVLNNVRSLRSQGVSIPIVLMSYCNPIHSLGVSKFFKDALSAGIDGLIIPDLIPEEATEYSNIKNNDLMLIFLVTPTTPKNRIPLIASRTKGFLYAVSMTGVTGSSHALPDKVRAFVKSIKAASKVPVLAGFGITTPAQAKAIAQQCDGVIIGSEIIRKLEQDNRHSFNKTIQFVKSLSKAIKNPSPQPSPLKKGRGR